MTIKNDPTIVFDSVSIKRDGRMVVEDFSVTLAGQRIGVIGRNGSGKSSLVRTLNGLLVPAAGNVVVHGQDVAKLKSKATQLTGFVFQNPDHQIIFPTVVEEVSFALKQLGFSKKDAEVKALDYLKDNGLENMAEKPVLSLSEGQKQLVCILSVLIGEPKVLVLDEPFSSLDFRRTRILAREIDRLSQQVVFISHDLDLLAHYDEVLWIEAGKLRQHGAPREVIGNYLEYEKSQLEMSSVGGKGL
ncbi:energy-coupling factor ABC transporter ATP-binding protein [Polycladidibacter stylochi]|uniref:energy-coupling factor ABC transporter ATP-binding protein n=1 Tax=Polycladidibacter stylochi TaxID=1807766 RepID=UPI00082C3889|nr:ABC transporter ATP-binding protein [Pseudovibrio stylochi]